MVKKTRLKLKDFKQLIELFIISNKWPSADGTIRDIHTMETTHIINCIKKIKRDKWREIYLAPLCYELRRRVIASNALYLEQQAAVDELIDDATKV